MMFGDMATLDSLRKNVFVHQRILWDIEPKQLMEPRCRISETGEEERNIINGYLFYIDGMTAKKPKLFLMCHTASGYAETVARLDEVPDELIAEAVEENKDKEYFRMYPINEKLKNWLKKELMIEP